MKYNKIFFIVAMTAVILSTGSCKKEKFEINSNPDDVTDASVTPSVLLPGALQATSSIVDCNFWRLSWWMGHQARSGSYQSLNEEETYAFTNDFMAADAWNALYANANNYNIMINKAAALGQGTYEAIGRIMKSHNMALVVDIYNNAPYSDAFKGTVSSTPKYDKGVDIYNAIFADLDKAVVLLDDPALTATAANPDIATADFVYAGNTTRWKQFANTLRLRLLVHLHNGVTTNTVAAGVNVPTQMSKITADGFLTVSAHLQPGFSGTKPAPYYRLFVTNEAGTGSQRDFIRASEYAINYYKYNGDPRIDRFYVAGSGGQKGIIFGTPSGAGVLTGAELSSVRGPGLIPSGAASRAWILTAAESYFLQAEARQRGFLTSGPTAAALLTSGIRESFVWLGLTSAQADAYIALNAGYPDVDITAPSIVAGQPGGGVFTILSQKWFALNSVAPFEVWSDYRRTDVTYGAAVDYTPGPTLSVDPNRTATSIPRRLFYPQNEYNYNAANVAAEGSINVFSGKIFWDLN